MIASAFVDHNGTPILLGPKIGEGAEGVVFEVKSDPALVAKIYKLQPPSDKAQKLKAMVAIARKELVAYAAWPTAVLFASSGGPVSGLVMRSVKGFKEVHCLYSPAHRKIAFPHADWAFLIRTAANCAAAIETLHQQSIVIGDVNQRNIMVSDQAIVALIDCDSFQVSDKGQLFHCGVGVPEFTPPELQGVNFRSTSRTINHDCFGLAVLVFQLLMAGKHPFMGRYSGAGEMPLDKAIKEFRYAFGQSSHSLQMLPPPKSLPISTIGPQLTSLFDRAFSREAAINGTRPRPTEWHAALTKLSSTLRECGRDSGHRFPATLPNCPWCDLVNSGAPNLFVSVSFSKIFAQSNKFNLADVWSRIDRVARPAAAYVRPNVGTTYAGRSWPSHLPQSMPAKPPTPAILASPPKPPPPRLPPRKLVKVMELRGPKQRTAAIAFLVAVVWAVPSTIIVVGVSRYLSASIRGVFWAAIIFGMVIAIPATSWVILEIQRLGRQRRSNRDYEIEERARRAIASEQLDQWTKQFEAKKASATREYVEECRKWEHLAAVIKSEVENRRKAAIDARSALQMHEQNVAAALDAIGIAFDRKKADLRAAHDRLAALSQEQANERIQMQAVAREMQLEQFLSGIFIDDYEIPNIGPTRKAALASFGIESAQDVEESAVLAVPGFGPAITQRLIRWRRKIEGGFVFDPKIGVPENLRRPSELKFFQARQPFETALTQGEMELKAIVERASREMKTQQGRAIELISRSMMEDANFYAIPPSLQGI